MKQSSELFAPETFSFRRTKKIAQKKTSAQTQLKILAIWQHRGAVK